MCKIIAEDYQENTVTVKLDYHELQLIIDKYDTYAGASLRENNLQDAMFWVSRAEKLAKIKKAMDDNC